MSVKVSVDFSLEEQCGGCHGTGRIEWDRGRPCYACDQTGVVLTELGANVAEFLEQRYGLNLKPLPKQE